MKITILGTGTFFINTERSGPAYLLENDNKKILIDCGPGTLVQLSKIAIKPEDLDYIFITHFHADHTTDLFALQMNIRLRDAFVGDLKKELKIFGPKGITEFTKKLSEIYQSPAFQDYDRIKYFEITSKTEIEGFKVTPFKVEHIALGQSAEAIALRFESEGKSFVFSGDSNDNKGLQEASENADLFICDTSQSEGTGNPAHLDTISIGKIAEKSKVKKLVLSHFYPLNDKKDLLGEVKKEYRGDVLYGKDLMEFKL